jgi:hypothetical protein
MPGRGVFGEMQKLFPATKKSGNHTRVSVAINSSNNPKRLLVWRISNQITSDNLTAN